VHSGSDEELRRESGRARQLQRESGRERWQDLRELRAAVVRRTSADSFLSTRKFHRVRVVVVQTSF